MFYIHIRACFHLPHLKSTAHLHCLRFYNLWYQLLTVSVKGCWKKSQCTYCSFLTWRMSITGVLPSTQSFLYCRWVWEASSGPITALVCCLQIERWLLKDLKHFKKTQVREIPELNALLCKTCLVKMIFVCWCSEQKGYKLPPSQM